jgi:GT2 family glycosyltransferase
MTGGQTPGVVSPSVVFVVVNWNQRQLTLDCLASLQQQNYRNFAIALVDNGSTDDSVSAVRAAFPDVAVFENGSNLGIAAANNVGIRYALEAKADYVFLLNNDTVVDPEMLGHLVEVAESDPRIGMTGPTMLYFDQPEIIWCAGNSIDWRDGSTARLRAGDHRNSLDTSSVYAVDFITSCAVCIKSSVLEAVGLMDERYFIYYDETDWFARASAQGWKAVYVPRAMMWHKVSATMGESSPTTDYYMSRNRFLFLAKNLSGLHRPLALTRAALRTGLTIAAYSIKNQQRRRLANRNAKLAGLQDALRNRWGPMRAEVARMCTPKRS